MRSFLSLLSLGCLLATVGCSEIIRPSQQVSSTDVVDVVGDPSDTAADSNGKADIVGSGTTSQDDANSYTDAASPADGLTESNNPDAESKINEKEGTTKPVRLKTAGRDSNDPK